MADMISVSVISGGPFEAPFIVAVETGFDGRMTIAMLQEGNVKKALASIKVKDNNRVLINLAPYSTEGFTYIFYMPTSFDSWNGFEANAIQGVGQAEYNAGRRFAALYAYNARDADDNVMLGEIMALKKSESPIRLASKLSNRFFVKGRYNETAYQGQALGQGRAYDKSTGRLISYLSCRGDSNGTKLAIYYMNPDRLNNDFYVLTDIGGVDQIVLNYRVLNTLQPHQRYLLFLNDYGGIDGWVFDLVPTIGLQVEKTRIYDTNGWRCTKITRYETTRVSTGYIPKEEAEALAELVYARRAWDNTADGDPTEVDIMTDTVKTDELNGLVELIFEYRNKIAYEVPMNGTGEPDETGSEDYTFYWQDPDNVDSWKYLFPSTVHGIQVNSQKIDATKNKVYTANGWQQVHAEAEEKVTVSTGYLTQTQMNTWGIKGILSAPKAWVSIGEVNYPIDILSETATINEQNGLIAMTYEYRQSKRLK